MRQFHLEGSRGQFNPNRADQMVAFGKPYRLHSLIQAGGMSPWFLRALSSETWEAMFTDYIATVLGHFTGARSIVVVGECLDHDGNGYADNAFLEAAGGIGYVARAFELARDANPTARLCLSENQIEFYSAKRTALYGLLDMLVPDGNIDEVSVQSHLSISKTYDFDAIRTMFETINGYGLKANITELDVSAQEELSAREYDIRAADLVYNYVSAWKAADCGDELLCWGLSDEHSWLHTRYPDYTQRPLPFDADLKPKRMYGALKAALRA